MVVASFVGLFHSLSQVSHIQLGNKSFQVSRVPPLCASHPLAVAFTLTLIIASCEPYHTPQSHLTPICPHFPPCPQGRPCK